MQEEHYGHHTVQIVQKVLNSEEATKQCVKERGGRRRRTVWDEKSKEE